MPEDLDIEHLRSWVGSSTEATDVLTPGLAERFAATFDLPGGIGPGEPAPAGVHWCLAPATAPTFALGPDGHPERGGFLPPVPLPRRMWAGGELIVRRPFAVGDVVQRRSEVTEVAFKVGRTGPLCFVTVQHDYGVGGESRLAERQNLVFCGLDAAAASPSPPASAAIKPTGAVSVMATPTLLFRYSALTFNGHRIHYDRRYCVEEEGYPGLVVHGPLQATLLLHHAVKLRKAVPSRFRFRSVAPLFDGVLSIDAGDDGSAVTLRCADPSGRTTMTADAEWA